MTSTQRPNVEDCGSEATNSSNETNLTKRSVVGVVLAGGSSRRLGGIPKGLEVVGGKRSIDRVVEALRGATSAIVLAANDPDAAMWLPGVAVVADRFPGTGGLAGVEAALASRGDVMVVAWDMPFVSPALVELIIGEARHHDSRVTVPESRSPYGFEPFCAYYAASVQPALADFLRGAADRRAIFLRASRACIGSRSPTSRESVTPSDYC